MFFSRSKSKINNNQENINPAFNIENKCENTIQKQISEINNNLGITPRINKENDSVFRESDINEILKFHFWNNRRPLSRSSDISSPTIISQNESDIIINSPNFKDLFDASSGTQLRFSLLNLLWTWQKVYPFLEYYVDFWWIPVPDKYFTINGEWNYKDYQVNTIIQKPTVKESILWNFTSIF